MSELLSRISIQNKFSRIFLLNNFVCLLSSLQEGEEGGGELKKKLQTAGVKFTFKTALHERYQVNQ